MKQQVIKGSGKSVFAMVKSLIPKSLLNSTSLSSISFLVLVFFPNVLNLNFPSSRYTIAKQFPQLFYSTSLTFIQVFLWFPPMISWKVISFVIRSNILMWDSNSFAFWTEMAMVESYEIDIEIRGNLVSTLFVTFRFVNTRW